MSKSLPYQALFAGTLLAFCFLFGTATAIAQSQASTGQIVGTVKDPQGAAVPNATVTVNNIATGLTQTLTTNNDGIFRAVLLPVGDYTVKVRAQGFGEFTQSGYKVEVGSTQDANITLQINAVNEVVQVTSTINVETTAVQSSATVGSLAISELPINGRRFQDFVLLTPTADVDPTRNQITLAGQRGINTNIQIDGADYTNPFFGGIRGGERSSFAPTFPQEAIREFQVVASGFSAEFGRSTGGVVNAVTKSGENRFRGSAFYLGRPQEWAHRNAFGQISSPTQHQYGGSLGGPVVKDKFFFFISAEQQRLKQQRAVRFDRLLGYDATAAANAGVTEAFSLYKSLEGPYTQTNDGITALGRLDFTFNTKYNANIRYNYSFNKALNAVTAGTSLDPITNSALSNNGTEGNSQNTFVGQFNSFFTSTLINELRGQYSRENRPRTPNELSPLVGNGIGNYGTVSFLPTTQYDFRRQVADNLTWLKGNHSIKVGADYNYAFADQVFAFRQNGNFFFSITGTDAATLTRVMRIMTRGNANNGTTITNDVANRFDDTTVRYSRNVGNGIAQMDYTNLAFFGQDAWKVRPNLTLNFGLRWEAQYMPTPDTSNTTLTAAVQGARFPNLGLRGVNPGVIPDQTDQWAPRIGFAWDPFNDGKTVIRGNVGLFYANTPLLTLAGPMNNFRSTPGDVTLQLPSTNLPATLNTTYKQFQSIGIDLNNFTLDKLPVLTVAQVQQINKNLNDERRRLGLVVPGDFEGYQLVTVGDQLKNPRSLQFNFSAQRELPKGFTIGLDLNYVNTVHLNRNRDYDVPDPKVRANDKSLRPVFGIDASAAAFGLAQNRPIAALGNAGYVQVRESSARGLYKALTLSGKYRFAKGQFDMFYTLSKNLDDDSTERNASFAEYDNSFDLRPEYNFSRSDRRHRLTFNSVFNLPLGFQLSTLGRFVSGQPIDVVVSSILAPTVSGLTAAQYAALVTLASSTSGDLNLDRGNSDRPYLAPGVPLKRNAYRNFGNKNIDLRIQRDFRIGEHFKLSPSFEVFNLSKAKNITLLGTTVTNYGNPGVNERTGETLAPSNPDFLQKRSTTGNYLLNNRAGTPLAMQWGVRMNF